MLLAWACARDVTAMFLPLAGAGRYVLATFKSDAARTEHPVSPNRERWAGVQLCQVRRAMSPCSSYQGIPLRSGACGDVSGKPADMFISAMTRTPANPPPRNANNTHQIETMVTPLRRSRHSPGSTRPGCAVRSTASRETEFLLSDIKSLVAEPPNNVPRSVPTQRSTCLILGHPSLEEVLLLLEVDHFAHPRERVGVVVHLGQVDAFQAAIGNVLHVLADRV